MHLPFFLTLMEQFNVISEGNRAAGKARVMREGYPAPLSGAACGSREWSFLEALGEISG